MPDRIPTFRPPWVNKPKRARRPDTARPSAAARGYCSRGWKLARAERLLLDHYQCQACGVVIAGGRGLHVDHVVPKAEGGTDLVANLQTLCRPCHSRKTVAEQGGVGQNKSSELPMAHQDRVRGTMLARGGRIL